MIVILWFWVRRKSGLSQNWWMVVEKAGKLRTAALGFCSKMWVRIPGRQNRFVIEREVLPIIFRSKHFEQPNTGCYGRPWALLRKCGRMMIRPYSRWQTFFSCAAATGAVAKWEKRKGYPLLDSPLFLWMVRERRLELPYPKVPDPKSGASANSATLACYGNNKPRIHGALTFNGVDSGDRTHV